MPQEQPAIHESAGESTAVQPPAPAVYDEPLETGGWEEDSEQLPRRPRRRLLAPVPLALIGVLLTACGFLGGVLVEKGQSSSSSSSATGAAGLASRVAALRGGSSSSASRSGAAGALAGAFGGAGAATTGEVSFIHGSTLYVSTAEGNTVKVSTSAGSSVTKTVKSSVKDIHPGETVVVTGSKGTNGAVSAESIRVGSSGAGGGLASLFGGGGSSSAGSGSSGAGGSGGGAAALFGSGG